MSFSIVNPCKNCRRTDGLRSRYNTKTGQGWVHCDFCGQASQPVPIADGVPKIAAKWNEANPVKD